MSTDDLNRREGGFSSGNDGQRKRIRKRIVIKKNNPENDENKAPQNDDNRFVKVEYNKRPQYDRGDRTDRPGGGDRPHHGGGGGGYKKPYNKFGNNQGGNYRGGGGGKPFNKFGKPGGKPGFGGPGGKFAKKKRVPKEKNKHSYTVHQFNYAEEKEVRLNKFLANAGICSRREADKLIQQGIITINGEVATELGCRVRPGDKVMYNGKVIGREDYVYVLLNKPKDYISTMNDPEGRKTVMDIMGTATKERIFPVGRLDRNTTGILLFTNDGELAYALTHPKYNVKKVYIAVLDKNLSETDMDALLKGVELEDGPMAVDNIAYIQGDKRRVGIEIHSGRNRIIHRLFEHLGYELDQLDRVYYAGLTKKDLPRGRYRFLNEQEVHELKKLSEKILEVAE